MTTDALEQISRQLAGATSYAAIFGPLPKGDVAARRAALRKQFACLARMVHPDRAPAGSQAQAADVFNTLNETRLAAEVAIEDGNYDLPFAGGTRGASRATTVLQSKAGSYRLRSDLFRVGDFSVLYRGESAGGAAVIAKVAAEPSHNFWLEREAEILHHFVRATAGSDLEKISQFVPRPMDTFLVEGEGHRRHRVNILEFRPGFVSVAEILEARPRGLDPRDAGWIGRRVLAQTLAAAMAGVVHGAMVPDHVLVDPITHEPLHIGWVHAVEAERGAHLRHVIDRYRDFYPPEVLGRDTVDHTTDLYMAGKTMTKLLGGNVRTGRLPRHVPKEIARIIAQVTDPSPRRRPNDGKAVLDEFTRVVRALWGQTYRPLFL